MIPLPEPDLAPRPITYEEFMELVRMTASPMANVRALLRFI